MPTQYPTLSQEEQTVRWKKMAGKNLFPNTYRWSGQAGTAVLSRTTANGFNYLTIPFQSDNNSAISILEVSSGMIPSRGLNNTDDHRKTFVVQVSYAPDLNTDFATVSVTPTTPIDKGNIIYNVFDSTMAPFNTAVPPPFLFLSGDPFNFYHFHRFTPYNYLLKFNQIIYIHIGYLNDSHVLDSDGVYRVNVILHMLNTGLKT